MNVFAYNVGSNNSIHIYSYQCFASMSIYCFVEPVVAIEGQYHPEATYLMPRVDVAAWMLNNIESNEWNRKCVAIGVTSKK